jgi:PAS domain S-box-containing protein
MGCIVVPAKFAGYFDEEKQHLYQTLAEQGAVALRAAHLRETIRESQQRLSLLVQQSPLAVIEWNMDLQVLSWNPAAERIFGYTREEALGRHTAGFIEPEEAQSQADQVWQAVLAREGGAHDIHDNVTKDGRRITCEWFYAPLVGADGQVIGITSLVQDITERKRAEMALQESEERHRSLFENSPISLWEEDFSRVKEYFDDLQAMGVTDFRAFFENHPEAVAHCAGLVKVLDVNKATVALMGARDKDELLAGLSKVLVDEALVVFREELITLAEGGQRFESEVVHRTLSGEERFIALNLSVAPGSANSLGKVLVSVLDITERRRAEEALRESEQKYRFITEKMTDTVWLMDMEFKPTFISPSVTRTLGYTLEELQALSLDELLTPESFEFAMKTVATELPPERLAPRPYERSVTVELEFRRKDGSPLWSESTITLLRDSEGRPTGLMGVGRDITERKRAEEALQESEATLRSVFRAAPIGIGLVIDRVFQWTNETLHQMLGYTAEELEGQSARMVYPSQEEYERVGREKYADIAERGTGSIETHFQRKDGEIIDVLLSSTPLDPSDLSKGVTFTALDITERKRAEAQLERNLRETRVRYEISQALAGAETEDEVLDVLIQHAGLYPQAHATVFTFDRTGDELAVILRHDNPFESGVATLVPIGAHIPASYYPVLDLLSAVQPFVSDDVFADERVDPTSRKTTRQSGAASLAMFPLTVGNEWMGFILAMAKSTGYFDEEKQHLYQTLAEQGAVALRAARLRETIRESQQRLSLLVQQSPLAVIEWNTDFQVVSWNPAAERIFGYTREEALGRHAAGFIAPAAARPLVDQFWQDLSVQQGGTHSINDNLTKDGRLITCEWFNSLLVGADSKAVGIASLVEDITQRKQAEEALRESEEKFRTFTESAPVAIMIYQDYHCVYANPEAEQITGYTHQELEQVRFFDFIHPDYKDMLVEAGKALERGESPPHKADFKIIAKNGDEKWLDGRLEMIDYAGKRAALISAMDITERKQVEEALHESEERYRRLAEAAHDMIFIINREGNVDYVNSFATQQFGRLPEEIFGRSHAELFLSDDAERQQLSLRQVFKAGQPLYVENLTQFPNQRMWLGTWLVPIKDEAGQVKSVLGVSRDITERKQAEEEIQRLNAELEQRVVERTAQLEAANKELEAFSYSVSHDLRAPLRAVDGFSRILLEDYLPQLPPEVTRHLRIIFESTQQMGRLIDGLLAFSRLSRQPLDKQPISSTDLARQALDSLSSEQQGQPVEISMGELPPCQGDPTLLRQVWVNLISNALKFTRGREGARIEIGCVERDGEQVYFVKDNGVGFDMRYADKLFGVFQRLHQAEEYEGTGVGLATVQRIIHRHGGRIWAEAELDKGATFYFTI